MDLDVIICAATFLIIFSGAVFGLHAYLSGIRPRPEKPLRGRLYIHDPGVWEEACRIAAGKFISRLMDGGAYLGIRPDAETQKRLNGILALSDREEIGYVLRSRGVVDGKDRIDASRLPDAADIILSWMDSRYE